MLNSIRIFLKVVEHGSFSRAGEVLRMAPSSVARSVDRLEAELGATLILRSTRRLSLTEEGLRFSEGARRLLSEVSALQHSVKQSRHEPEGDLRISVFESFGRMHVCPLLPEFLHAYPKVNIHIELDNRMVDLVTHDIDLAIRVERPVDSDLRARKLFTNRMLLCAAPKYLLQTGMPETPEAVAAHNCLVLGNDRQQRYWYFRRDQDMRRVAIRGNLVAKGATPILEAVLGGLGVALLPVWMVHEHITNGSLMACLDAWECSFYESTLEDVYIAYRNETFIKPAIRAFIDFMVDRMVDVTA